jgi:hypothetical protein
VRTELGMRNIKGKYNKRTELAWRVNKSMQKASGERTKYLNPIHSPFYHSVQWFENDPVI